MDKLNIAEIKEALSKATPGPWRVETEHDLWKAIKSGHGFQHTMVADCVHARDAELFAHAPTWLASLVSQVEEMQKTLEQIATVDVPYAPITDHSVMKWYEQIARDTLQSLKGDKP